MKHEKVVKNSQHGFAKGKLITLTTPCDEISGLVDQVRAVDVVHLGFIKPFHSITCEILIEKLVKYGWDK